MPPTEENHTLQHFESWLAAKRKLYERQMEDTSTSSQTVTQAGTQLYADTPEADIFLHHQNPGLFPEAPSMPTRDRSLPMMRPASPGDISPLAKSLPSSGKPTDLSAALSIRLRPLLLDWMDATNHAW